jgi:hypothetical protein
MRLPNAAHARADQSKIRDYLLDPAHRSGGSKARLFGRFGYGRDQWEDLRMDLLRHAVTGQVVAEVPTDYGRKYLVRGSFESRSGRFIELLTIWIIDDGEDSPRFVTAYPGDPRR